MASNAPVDIRSILQHRTAQLSSAKNVIFQITYGLIHLTYLHWVGKDRTYSDRNCSAVSISSSNVIDAAGPVTASPTEILIFTHISESGS